MQVIASVCPQERKLIEDTEGNINLSVSDTKIKFELTDIALTSKLIDGTFPDYEKVIPKNNDKELLVDTKLIYEAVDRVSTVSSEKSRSVKFSILDNIVNLSSNSAESGSGAEDIEVNYSGEKMEIGYNAKYLLEVINQIESDKVKFKHFDPSSPLIIEDPKEDNALYILMPMRI